MTGVRKVIYRDNLHHATGTTYDNTSTSFLKASSANNWTMSYNVTTGGRITGPNVGSDAYLTNVSTNSFTEPSQAIFECAGEAQVIGAGMGMLFMADGDAAGFTNAYRVFLDGSSLFIQKTTNGGSSWNLIGQTSYAAVNNTVYHFRVYYSGSALSFYGKNLGFTAGRFYVWVDTDRNTINEGDYDLTATDGSPLTSGGYMGFYQGINAIGTFDYLGCFRLWELGVEDIEYVHEMDEDSIATVKFERHPDQYQQYWVEDDKAEIWVTEANRTDSKLETRLTFFGRVERTPEFSARSRINLIGLTAELGQLNWQNGSAFTGTVEAALQDILPEDGGTEGATTSMTDCFYAHRNNISLTGNTTNRFVQGGNARTEVKKILKEEGGFTFMHPDGRFFIRNTLVNASQTLDTSDSDVNFVGVRQLRDATQIVNDVDVYYNGWTTPSNSNDGTSRSAYSNRGGQVVDMMSQGSTQAGNVASATTGEYAGSPTIAIVSLAQQRFDILPGHRIDAIIAGTEIGTNATGTIPDSTVGNWSAESCTCTRVEYKMTDGIHRIVLVKNDQGSPNEPLYRSIGNKASVADNVVNLYSLDT